MAVVQISRIQVRRGRELVGTGVPQLASGELGWAIDTQKLYIGSGAVSEGAPSVDNIEILTNQSNILDLANQYVYGGSNIQTGDTGATPVIRSIKEKLDDTVSVKDFGADGNGTITSTELQRAIDELFLTRKGVGGEYSNVTLRIPAGTYIIDQAILVPPFANIIGDGPDKTRLINSGNAAEIFYTKGTDSTSGEYIDDSLIVNSENQPRSICIQGMTIEQSSFYEILRVQNCKDSVFRDINFIGNWETGAGATGQGAVKMYNSGSNSLKCDNNKFINCSFSNLDYLCHTDDDCYYNLFENGYATELRRGFVWGEATDGSAGTITGPSYNKIEKFRFTNISQSAIVIESGDYNTSHQNMFFDVGTSGGSDRFVDTITHPVIIFRDKSNVSINDYFQRAENAMISDFSSFNYLPEIEGQKDYKNDFRIIRGLGASLAPSQFLNVPVDQNRGTIKINYTYGVETDEIYRNGVMTIIFDKEAGTASLTDEFSHSGIGDPENMSFSLDLSSFNTSSSFIPVLFENILVDGLAEEDGTFKFTVEHVS